MDWLTFIATCIKALPWPIVTGIGLYVFKTPLSELIGGLGKRVESFKGFGIEVWFRDALEQAEQLLPAPEAEEITRREDSVAQRIETFSALPPPYIVSQSYNRLMQTIREVLKERALPGRGPRSRADHMRAARAEGLLNDDEISAIDRLRDMRNSAVHSTDASISMTDALRYQDMAEFLIDAIKLRSAGK
jgi:hypothetical protein